MIFSRIFLIVIFWKATMLIGQSNKTIYKNLISKNFSMYDIKDSTIYIEFELVNTFRDDTSYFKNVFLLNSNNINSPNYIFSGRNCNYFIKRNEYTYQCLNTNNFDTPIIFNNMNLDEKKVPTSNFYLLLQIPKIKKGDFSKKFYGKYQISKSNDTFILYQKYKKENRTRKIYFTSNYKIFKLEEFNFNDEEPDAYSCLKFHYFTNNCLDSLSRINKLGLFTPVYKRKAIPAIKDTVNKTTTHLYTFGTNDSILEIKKNKYYLFDYWYLSCSPCLQMMPFLNNLHNKIDTNKLIIIGVNPYDKQSNILKYLQKRNYHFLQLDKSKNVPFHKIESFPTLILMDANFNEIKKFVGYGKYYSEYEITRYLKSLGLMR